MALLLTLTAVFLVAIAFLGPDSAGEANKQVDELIDTIIDESRVENKVNNYQIEADEGVSDSWIALIEDLEAVRASGQQDLCILPIDVSYTSTEDTIRFLKDDDDLLISLSFTPDNTQDQAQRFEAYPFRNMDVRYGILKENGEHFGSLQMHEIESEIIIKKFQGPESVANVLIDGRPGSVTESGRDSLLMLQPFYAFYASDADHSNIYDSRFSASQLGPARYSSRPAVALASKDELIIVMESPEVLDNDRDHAKYNVLSSFNSQSALGTSLDGLPFCSRADGNLLKGDNCQCSVAKNKEMCQVLTEDNCGVNCRWDETWNDREYRTEKACIVDERGIKEFYDALAGLYDEMVQDVQEQPLICWDYYRLDGRDVPDDNLGDFVEGLELIQNADYFAFASSSNAVFSNSYMREDYRHWPVLAFEQDQRTRFTGADHSGALDINDVVIEPTPEDEYLFFAQRDADLVDVAGYETFIEAYETRDLNMRFCDPSVPYDLNLIDETSSCDAAENIETCLVHGMLYKDSCQWVKKSSSTAARVLTLGTALFGDSNECREYSEQSVYQLVPDVLSAFDEVRDQFISQTSGPISYDPQKLRGDLFIASIGDDAYLSLYQQSDTARNFAVAESYTWRPLLYLKDVSVLVDGNPTTSYNIPPSGASIRFQKSSGKTTILIDENNSRGL
ncbi:MAG: hypothetical protein ACOC32_04290 [Nanoarchaeota archaeon]